MSVSRLMSLVDFLAYKAGCQYVSDLYNLSDVDQLRLSHALEKVEPEDFTLKDWNDALEYIFKEPKQSSEEAAKAVLQEKLSKVVHK